MADELKPEEGFAARLRMLMGSDSEAAFAARCPGVSRPLLRKYLSGSEPGMSKVVAIAKARGVRIEWLATGEGPMRPESAPAAQLDTARLKAVLSAVEGHLRDQRQTLDPDTKAELIALIYKWSAERDPAAVAANVEIVADFAGVLRKRA